MGIFKNSDEKLEYLYKEISLNGRINNLIYNCYEYGKLTPKKEKEITFKKLKKISEKNKKNLSEFISKPRRRR